MKTDVLIIGGGAVGASVAYFLGLLEPGVDVTVVERDSSYQFASTPLASGGVRRLFSLPENIELSNFSIPFFEEFPSTMAVNGEPAEIGFKKNGYLALSARLGSGEQIQAEHFVNAAGAWAKNVCAMLDVDAPIEPLRRFEHYFKSREPIEPLPYIKDPDRLAFRPEGQGYSGGLP